MAGSRNRKVSRKSSEQRPLEDMSARKQNRKNQLSDSDSEYVPNAKKAKILDDAEQSVQVTPKRIKVEKQEVEIKDEPQGMTNSEEGESIVKEEDVSSSFGLSEYELQIQKNIAARAKFMDSLEIFTAKENLLELSPQIPKSEKKEARGIAREKKSPSAPQEIRRSLRQRNLTPDGANLVLPSDREVQLSESRVEERPRPPAGPAPMMDYYERSNKEDCVEVLQDISRMAESRGSKQSVWSGSMTSVLNVMKKMKIDDEHVAKVTPQRTFSIQVHPSEEKTLVLIGAKWGELGVWDVERKDKTDGAYYFDVHSRPINCLTIDKFRPEHVYTVSYDASFRRTDLAAGIVQQVYCYSDDDRRWISWHDQRDENCFILGGNLGDMVHVDIREPPESATKYVCHQKSTKVVTSHPTQNNYFATSSLSSVCLWDMRSHKKYKPISEVIHGKNVSGLEFSPVTGNYLVSTSGDDNIRIISSDLTSLNVVKKIPHNNFTGRWLTTFRTRFVPNREDLVVVGSLKQPRRIEVFDVDGRLQHNFMGDSFGSVTSVTAMHPTLPILAGSNSSGKAFVFKST